MSAERKADTSSNARKRFEKFDAAEKGARALTLEQARDKFLYNETRDQKSVPEVLYERRDQVMSAVEVEAAA